MTQTIDANVLLYASNAETPEHEQATKLLEHLVAGPQLVVILWPTILAYLRIGTHPGIFGRPLTPRAAEDNIEALLAPAHVRPAGELDGFWDTYRAVTADVAPRGNLVLDSHLVALMRQHGITTIWSRDRDLRKFDGITTRDPFSDRYRDGFDPRPTPRKRRR
jgi:uncharacterized protein